MMPKLYGLKNCDSCRKAMRRLNEGGLAYEFVDLKTAPPSRELVGLWLKHVPVDRLINRRGTTWRKLDEVERTRAETPDGAAALIEDNPSLAKRPIIEHSDGMVTVGFDEEIAGRLGLR